jgi:hypothetical protein
MEVRRRGLQVALAAGSDGGAAARYVRVGGG